jgi:hypothetical protein
VDENVRKGHDIDSINFQVSPEIVKFVEKTWGDHFYPSNVKAVPYKINLYKKGDKFVGHKDTPDKNLIGTFLLGMSYKKCERSFKVDVCPNAKYKWDRYETWGESQVGTWCAFYADVPHRVKHKNDTIRATMSFKIYSNDSDFEMSDMTVDFVDNYLKNNPLPPTLTSPNITSNSLVGLILSHDYSLNTTSLKGIDNLWYYVAQKIAKNVVLVPVIVSTSMLWYRESNEPPQGSMQVFSLSDSHIRYLNGEESEQPEQPSDKIDFYKMSYDGYKWMCNYEDYIEYTGNESQPMSEDSLYIYKALLLTF